MEEVRLDKDSDRLMTSNLPFQSTYAYLGIGTILFLLHRLHYLISVNLSGAVDLIFDLVAKDEGHSPSLLPEPPGLQFHCATPEQWPITSMSPISSTGAAMCWISTLVPARLASS